MQSKRDEQFALLIQAQERALDLTNWHEFLKAIASAGYRSEAMVTSKNSLVYAYAMFLIGKDDYGVSHARLRSAVARWFFVSTVAERFGGSFETAMEQELTKLRAGGDEARFLQVFEETLSPIVTDDFWNIRLPDALDSSGARTPSLFAYHAALCVLKGPVLFSTLTVWELFDPSHSPRKSNLDRHHLFPRAYLKSIGIADRKVINRIANTTLVEWPDNIKIGAKSPAEYVPEIRELKHLDDRTWRAMCHAHALPEGWHEMDYFEFLAARRKLMANVIKQAYTQLGA